MNRKCQSQTQNYIAGVGGEITEEFHTGVIIIATGTETGVTTATCHI